MSKNSSYTSKKKTPVHSSKKQGVKKYYGQRNDYYKKSGRIVSGKGKVNSNGEVSGGFQGIFNRFKKPARREVNEELKLFVMFPVLCVVYLFYGWMAHMDAASEYERSYANVAMIYFVIVLIALGTYGLLWIGIPTLLKPLAIVEPLAPPIKLVDIDRKFGTGEERSEALRNFVVVTVFSLLIIALVQLLISTLFRPQKWAVSVFEQYVFYIVAGISEEIAFRFTIQNIIAYILRKNLGSAATHIAVISSGVSFGLIHLGVYGNDIGLMVSVTIAGIILGYMYVLTDTMMSPIIAHSVNNFIASIGRLKTIETVFTPENLLNQIYIFLIVISSLIIFVVVVNKLAFLVKKKKETVEIDKNEDEIEQESGMIVEKKKTSKMKSKITIIILLVALILVYIAIHLFTNYPEQFKTMFHW